MNKDITVSSLNELKENVEQYLEREIESESFKTNSKARTSDFWQDIFKIRQNYPGLNDLLSFRRGSFTYGIGQQVYSEESERLAFENYKSMVSQFIPLQEIELSEPAFGAPLVFPCNKTSYSSVFVSNLGTYWRISKFIEKYLSGKNISALEIGAGFGVVSYQLVKSIPQVKSYTICDLPNNLYLSYVYLGMTSGKAVNLISDNDIIEGINFSLPHKIETISQKFNLVINTFSLQEMDLETVQSYIGFIHDHLAEDGIFYSVNSHNKAGVKRPDQYQFDRFHILSFSVFRNHPAGLFNSIPYEMVLGHHKTGDISYSMEAFNAICDLMQIGLSGALTNFCEKFVAGKLSKQDLENLHLVNQVFEKGPLSQKITHAFGSNAGEASIIFLRFCLLFMNNELSNQKWDSCLNLLAQYRGFERCILGVILHLSNKERFTSAKLKEEFSEQSPGLLQELSTLIDSKTLDEKFRIFLSRRLNVERTAQPIDKKKKILFWRKA